MQEKLSVPTKEFAHELLKRARRFGYDGDWPAIADFVREIHREAGIEISDDDLIPYDVEDK